jgi:hypothetical protein
MGLLKEDFEVGAISNGYSFKNKNIVYLPFYIKYSDTG